MCPCSRECRGRRFGSVVYLTIRIGSSRRVDRRRRANRPSRRWRGVCMWPFRSWNDEDFTAWYPRDGRPGLAPARLATVCVLQYVMNLSDRQAAEAVRCRHRNRWPNRGRGSGDAAGAAAQRDAGAVDPAGRSGRVRIFPSG
ncbi:transposase [Embleya sp. NPDC008237]|uniref:transposase n=1 Tax=Embleya sp. NPDC008237 TaxID=3363978 RepID=UPI0036E78B7C